MAFQTQVSGVTKAGEGRGFLPEMLNVGAQRLGNHSDPGVFRL